MAKPLITIVVCTYNRAQLLSLSLETLSQQTLAKSLYEVIVVDNNSTDNTAALVTQYLQHETNLHLAKELQQGLSYARNHGWQLAQADYVAYIDDDCQVSPTWGVVALEVIQKLFPPIFGGPAHPLYLTTRPHWFLDRYAERVWHGAQARELKSDEHLGGMNIVFRRSLLETLQGFNPQLGMKGTTIAYGEETDVVLRARQAETNLIVYYDPRLEVKHVVRPEKMTLTWRVRQSLANGYFSEQVFGPTVELSKTKFIRAIGSALIPLFIDFAVRIWRRDRTQFPYWQNFFYEQICQSFLKLGRLWGQMQ